MECILQNLFNWDIVTEAWPLLLHGFGMTLILIAALGGLPLAGINLPAIVSVYLAFLLNYPIIMARSSAPGLKVLATARQKPHGLRALADSKQRPMSSCQTLLATR